MRINKFDWVCQVDGRWAAGGGYFITPKNGKFIATYSGKPLGDPLRSLMQAQAVCKDHHDVRKMMADQEKYPY